MLSSPLTIHFEVTNQCNNHCPHCYASSWIDQVSKHKVDILDVAKKIAENDVFDLVITGGEPLSLNKKILTGLFNIFQENNIQFSLNTNGRLLSKQTCKQLITNGLNGVLVSLHSWDNELHDTMVNASNAAAETKRGIKNALEQGLHVTVNQVIGKQNISTMLQTGIELEKMGVNGLSFSRQLSPLGVGYNMEMIEAKEFLDEYIKCKETICIPIKNLIPTPFCADARVKDLMERLNCTGGITSAAVSCLGDVRFCPQDPKIWGNIFDQSLNDIWMTIVNWRNDLAIPAECKGCSFVSDCRGGCRVASKISGSNYRCLDPWATEPINNYIRTVIYRPFDPGDLHVLRSDIRFRRENGNIVLYCQNEFIQVNLDALQLIRGLPRKFVPNEALKNATKNRQQLLDFLELIYQKGFLIALTERKGGNENAGKN